jgi:hypothetical protein
MDALKTHEIINDVIDEYPQEILKVYFTNKMRNLFKLKYTVKKNLG